MIFLVISKIECFFWFQLFAFLVLLMLVSMAFVLWVITDQSKIYAQVFANNRSEKFSSKFFTDLNLVVFHFLLLFFGFLAMNVFNCSQTKFVAILLLLCSFYAIYRLTDFCLIRLIFFPQKWNRQVTPGGY